MNTGEMPSVTYDLKVGAENKKTTMVDYCENNLQSTSRARGGRMDLGGGKVNPKDQIKSNGEY